MLISWQRLHRSKSNLLKMKAESSGINKYVFTSHYCVRFGAVGSAFDF